MISIKEDKQFLIYQRKKGRPGFMYGIDFKEFKITKRETRIMEQRKADVIRKEQSDREVEQMMQTAELVSTSSSSLESDVSVVPVAGTSTANIVIEHTSPEDMEFASLLSESPRVKRKRGFRNTMTTKLCAVLDKYPLTWHQNECFVKGLELVNTLKVVNDSADRGEDYNKLFTKNEQQKQYTFLRNYLESTIRSQRINLLIVKSNEGPNLNDAFILFKNLIKITNYMNKIFGWHVFFGMCSTVTTILYCVVCLIYGDGDDSDFSSLFIYIAHTVIYVVAIIFLVIYCEGIEIQSKNIVKTCYSHQESLSGTVLENQLLRFAEISEHLLPHFTAAGFVRVNKSLLSSIFSATITYLIIIIQFDISLKKK
ncbi:unnamed protein product [Psylliodes chrysocephalus]|uniref:Gustatory receptor n=1 Tax=Psylliodes chrysocephalus TaxID=3402493 RepID=A0A9P0D6R2_9CUCU|nr:unnamed protein product [Psylliodes chrysocephala]